MEKKYNVSVDQGGTGSVKPSRISKIIVANSIYEAISKFKEEKTSKLKNTKFSNWSAEEI